MREYKEYLDSNFRFWALSDGQNWKYTLEKKINGEFQSVYHCPYAYHSYDEVLRAAHEKYQKWDAENDARELANLGVWDKNKALHQIYDRFYIFDVPPIEIFLTNDTLKEKYPESLLMQIYLVWLREIRDFSHSFYLSQNEIHRDWLIDELIEETNSKIVYDSLFVYNLEQKGLVDKWENLCDKYEYKKHGKVRENVEKKVNLYISTLSHPNIDIDYAIASPAFQHFNEHWFNLLFFKTQELENILKLPYSQYLKTTRLQAIRAFMRIIFDQRCSACFARIYEGESQTSHIYHKKLESCGNEQYSDIVLVCENCYQAI